MPDLILKDTGKVVHVPADMVKQALASGAYETFAGEQVALEGGLSVDAADASRVAIGVESADERAARERAEYMEAEHGDLGSKIRAGGEGLLRGATLGLSDAVARELGADVEDMRRRQEVNPGVSTTTEIAGAIAPAIASGGTGALGAAARFTPAGAASQIGSRIAAKGTYGAAALGYGAEGALFGAGQGVSDLSLSDDPVTFERALSQIGTGALLGGVGGAGVGVVGKAAAKGLRRASQALDDWKANPATAAGDDLSGLDFKGLREADNVEKARLAEVAAQQKVEVAELIRPYSNSIDEANAWLVAAPTQKRNLLRAKKGIQNLGANTKALGENPERALHYLEIQEQALREAAGDGHKVLAKAAEQDKKLLKELMEEVATTPDSVSTITLQNKIASRYGDYAGVKVSAKKGVSLTRAEADDFLRAMESGEVSGARVKALGDLDRLIEDNISLQNRIKTAAAPVQSARLDAIADAKEALKAGKSSLQSQAQNAASTYAIGAVTGLLPGGAIGAVGAFVAPRVAKKIGELVGARLGKAAGAAATSTKEAVDAFLSVGRKAAPASIPLATKTLSTISYSRESAIPKAVAREKGQAKGLFSAYQEREKEIRALVTATPEGLKLRPDIRHQISEQLRGVAAASPHLADQIETHTARRIEFLAKKMPKKPDIAAMTLGPSKWRPSDLAMRQFARTMHAVEHPDEVEKRLADGTVTPEDAEAYREVYPERHADLVQQILSRVPELRESLPYKRRLALSIFSGVAVDPAMHPAVLRILQSNFTEEPGTDGGMTPPKAQAQFGSVSKPEPTPAQERAS